MSRIQAIRRRQRALGRCGLLVALALAISPFPARAQHPPTRWLTALRIEPQADGWTLEVDFSDPLVVMGHAPRRAGRLVEVSVAPASGSDRARHVFTNEETLRPSAAELAPLREVRLEPQASGQALLVLSFRQDVRFDLRAAAGGRSLIVHLRAIADPRPPAASPVTTGESDVDAFMDEAHRAMVEREYQRAIALYSKVLSLPGGDERPDAQEYLGLARERNGQRAHARAEYELYLLRFPDGEAAERVRQRLEALLSSARSDRAPLRGRSRSRDTEFGVYGTVSTSYQRAESYADLSGAVMLDSSQIIDFDVTGLMRTGRLDARVRGSGYYRFDFLDGDTGRGSRIRYLNIDVRDRALRLRGVLGRQSAGGGGILGRYDGLSAAWSFHDTAYVGAAFGFPQTSFISNDLDTSQYFGSVRLGIDGWRDQFSGEVWAAGQAIDGLLDRMAAGYELRWIGPSASAFSALDYDFKHNALNLFMVSGSVDVRDGTSLNLLADYRRAPYLTTRNALIGQSLASIEAMRDQYSTGEIEQLASDRTGTAATITVGVAQRLGTSVRLTGDITATTLSATPASGGVAAMPSTGWEFFYLAQVIASDMLIDGDTGRAYLRIFDGFRYVGYTIGASGRIPVLPSFWLRPRIDVDYRDHEELAGRIAVRPGLRAEYRFNGFTLEGDFRLEWLRSVGGGVPQANIDAFGYLLDLTVRFDF